MSSRTTSSTATGTMQHGTMQQGSMQQGAMQIPHEKIAMRAYDKWCKRGCPQGTHMQDWFEAENELRTEMSRMGQTAATRR